tara:strand:+ start:946 stop:1209 length:264 start_codon:yes stop_codon:yes gene_type:complete
MKQKFTLVTFKIGDGENSYNDHTIFKKDITNMEDSEIVKDFYGDNFKYDYREVTVYSIQEIKKEEAETLQKLHMAFINQTYVPYKTC